ncbi:MAG: RNA-binding protein [Lentisphaerae bacterium]|nr:RNA-binding protein [Victivallaceae bacterium]MDD3703314.1 RNA-binding protein [Victivallaceae bacterium]NLK83447.1 RNA-binding protein [Lentisphaerota bacterium]
MNIYVGNMSYSMSEDELRDAFATYGTVTSARLVMDRETGRPKGFGFVEMANDNEANAAIEALNGTEMGGRELKINEARPREERPRRSFGSGGGNGGGGGNRRY